MRKYSGWESESIISDHTALVFSPDTSDFFEEIAFRGISRNPPPPSRVKLISNANKDIKAWRRVSLNPNKKNIQAWVGIDHK